MQQKCKLLLRRTTAVLSCQLPPLRAEGSKNIGSVVVVWETFCWSQLLPSITLINSSKLNRTVSKNGRTEDGTASGNC